MVTKYNLKNISGEYKIHVNNRFAIINSNEQNNQRYWGLKQDILSGKNKKYFSFRKKIRKALVNVSQNSQN